MHKNINKLSNNNTLDNKYNVISDNELSDNTISDNELSDNELSDDTNTYNRLSEKENTIYFNVLFKNNFSEKK